MATGTWLKKVAAAATLAVAGVLGVCSGASGAGLLVADGGLGGTLEIKEHRVNVTINNGIAVTEVTQVFHNTEKRQVEALYTFPVPKGASVSNFSMWINGKEMVGEVVEKQRAREIYDSYKQQRRDPGLLEQKDYKTFEMRIFPIAPDADEKVCITYYQELDFDKDWATYVYPLATSSKAGVDTQVHGVFSFAMQVKSAIPIATLESPSHKDVFAFTSHDEYFSEASLELPEGSLGKDIVLAYNLARPTTGADIITSRVDKEDGYFCMTITAGEELDKEQAGMDYVFVLDVSGSMQTEGKLQTSTDAARAFITTLGGEDRFDVMTFNVALNRLFSGLRPATPENQKEVSDFLGGQVARGGTVLKPAMSAAYAYSEPSGDRMLNVVILSDGMTEQQEMRELLDLIASRPKNTRVFCVGVGNEVNRPLLEQMAQQSGGLSAVISNEDNFERQAQAFRRKLQHPAATDLALVFEGGDVYDVVPKVLPSLYQGAPVRIYGRYRAAGTHQAHLTANIVGYKLDEKFPIVLPEQEDKNPEIERMWALGRCKELEADAMRGTPNAVQEIVRLGEAYSIVTEYTSFLVLENDNEYQRWKIERRNALRFERDRNAQTRLRKQLDDMRMSAATTLTPPEKEAAPGRQAAANPQNPKLASNAAPTPQPAPMPSGSSHGGGWNFSMPHVGGGGGGAIDPITGGIALGLGTFIAAARRKKRS